MPSLILIEEFHVSVRIPHDLPQKDCRAALRTLSSSGFRARFRLAVEQVFRRYESLGKARVALSR